MVDWSLYERCPYCFREWDCRRMLRSSAGSWFISPVYNAKTMAMKGFKSVPGSRSGYRSWGDASLKRPHVGRRKRGVR